MRRLLLFCLLLWPAVVQAQEDPTAALVARLEAARTEARLWELMPDRPLVPDPPRYVGVQADSLLWWARQRWSSVLPRNVLPEPDWPAPDTLHAPFVPSHRVVWEWKPTGSAFRRWYYRQTAEVEWTRGHYQVLTSLDTLETKELRARLQTLFGLPTLTVIEQLGESGLEAWDYVQFEYALFVNREVPVRILDVDGPFGQGLILLTDEAHTDWIPLLRENLETLLLAARPAPFRDYYFAPEARRWHLTSFDGEAFLTEDTVKPDPSMGRPSVPRPAEAAAAWPTTRPDGHNHP